MRQQRLSLVLFDVNIYFLRFVFSWSDHFLTSLSCWCNVIRNTSKISSTRDWNRYLGFFDLTQQLGDTAPWKWKLIALICPLLSSHPYAPLAPLISCKCYIIAPVVADEHSLKYFQIKYWITLLMMCNVCLSEKWCDGGGEQGSLSG